MIDQTHVVSGGHLASQVLVKKWNCLEQPVKGKYRQPGPFGGEFKLPQGDRTFVGLELAVEALKAQSLGLGFKLPQPQALAVARHHAVQPLEAVGQGLGFTGELVVGAGGLIGFASDQGEPGRSHGMQQPAKKKTVPF